MPETPLTRARMGRLNLSLAALLIALCALPGPALAQDDEDPYGGGAGEPCTSVICEGGVPGDGGDPYGGGSGEDPYGGGPQPGDGGEGEPCTSVICEAAGGAAENTSGDDTGDDTGSGGSDDGDGTVGSSAGSGSAADGGGDAATGGGSVTSGGDVSGVSSVTLARTGFDVWILPALGATFLAAGSAALLPRRRGVRPGA